MRGPVNRPRLFIGVLALLTLAIVASAVTAKKGTAAILAMIGAVLAVCIAYFKSDMPGKGNKE